MANPAAIGLRPTQAANSPAPTGPGHGEVTAGHIRHRTPSRPQAPLAEHDGGQSPDVSCRWKGGTESKPFRHGSADTALVHECYSAYPEVDRVLLSPPAGSMIGDVTTTTALHAALTGLAQRQRVTADNIANINTPGFLAGRTDFESALSGALSSGQTPTVSQGTTSRSLEPTNTNGNNVNLDSETLIATETGLRYQLALTALDGKYSQLRTALRTG